MYKKIASFVMGALLVVVPAAADEAAEKAYKAAVSMAKARQGYMQLQVQQMGAMASAATGDGEITPEVVTAAQNLFYLTQMMAGVFGEGSGLDVVDFSRAQPELWTNVAERDNLVKRLNGQSKRLLDMAVAGNSAEFQNAFKQLKGTCNKCHESFRAKDAPNGK